MRGRNLFVLSIFLCLGVIFGGSVAAGASNQGSLHVYGEAEVAAVPDKAVISVGVETTHTSVETAVSENSQRMNSVLAAVDSFEGEISSVSTGSYQVYSVREGSTTKYRVANILTVSLLEIEKLGVLIDTMITAGANQVQAVSFEASNAEELKLKAYQQAVAQAQHKARAIAEAAHVELGSILTITEESGSYAPFMMAESRTMLFADTEIRPESVRVTARVSMEYGFAERNQSLDPIDEIGASLQQLGKAIPINEIEMMVMHNLEQEELQIFARSEIEELIADLNSSPTYVGFYPMVITGNQVRIVLNDNTDITLTSFGSKDHVIVGGPDFSQAVISRKLGSLLLADRD